MQRLIKYKQVYTYEISVIVCQVIFGNAKVMVVSEKALFIQNRGCTEIT